MDIKPIPAFYCCYLLRSTIRHSSVYVGSSPDPARRLAQHNGRVQGGAVRTSRASLRPWEMTCIVAGFPSNIAALQFEWAWHNAHLTRHITPTERISFATTRTKTSKSGKATRRPGRPRTSLMDKLSNLHILLRTPYFSKWPLELRFFNEEVYRSWVTWCGRVDAYLRPGISVILDPAQTKPLLTEEFTSAQPLSRSKKADLIGKGGAEGVDPTYARLYDIFQKSQFLLDEDDSHNCSVCSENLDIHRSLFILCPSDKCYDTSHVACVAQKSRVEDEPSGIVPEFGVCPSCNESHPWPELMRQVTLRTRGEKEVQKLLSKKAKSRAATAAAILEAESEEEVMNQDDLTAQDIADEEGGLSDYVNYDDDDDASVASMDSTFSKNSKQVLELSPTKKPSKLEIVIEDSEDGG
ncbi:hypothetical protein LTR84_004113 [Exophiala bonariae]|uniref:GIY-YIG domain-containing protein n=1 Tax=Exophiala bonariae TaxID=1690606 RepID=A0AAV9N9H0_9EURO|nr:hypothetical protein LTR84_004113 [Exophiala bonariae]